MKNRSPPGEWEGAGSVKASTTDQEGNTRDER